MSDDPSCPVDEEELALRLMDGDRQALRALLTLYGGKVKSYLRKRYGDKLQEQEREEALNTALLRAWRYSQSINLERGSLGGWFLGIAQRCAIDILNRELGQRLVLLAHDPSTDPVGDCKKADEETDERVRKRLRDLEKVIDGLGTMQRAIVRADLACGGPANSARLAARFSSSVNSIYVSRHKAHEAIRKGMQQRGHYTDRPGGKK